MTRSSWEDVAQAKRQSLIDAIPERWRQPSIKNSMEKAGFANVHDYLDTILPKEVIAITKMNLGTLQKKLAAQELTAFEVTEAFCHRAALTHQLVNCCSEIFLEEALERAKTLDEQFQKTGKLAGKLHGIPISLKDQVDLPGKDSAIGFVALAGKPKTEMSLLAKILQDEGAVFYVKTAVPMAMMAPETISNVNGYTFNSVNLKLSAGGSSGGEGSILGAGAACCGFGTDIGGSIRIPSCFHGLYALKPSTGRIPYMNVTNSVSGQECVPSVIGPMARSLKDVELLSELIVGAESWNVDPKVLPIPWKDMSDLKERSLVLGVWKFDGQIMPHPPIQRALKEVVELLKLNGHEVIEIEFPFQERLVDTISRIFCADARNEIDTLCKISGEPVVPIVKRCTTYPDYKQPIGVNAWWDLCNEAYDIKQEFLAFWKGTSKLTKSGKLIDSIICPVWPTTSSLPDPQVTLNYTVPFNLCDCASVVMPVSTVDSKIDVFDEKYQPVTEEDAIIYKSYNPELFDKMPVCIQVVTKKTEEEKALAIASTIEALLSR